MSKRRTQAQSNRIAVVGAACRFPGADSPEALFDNVLAGRREFRTTPPERFPLDDYYDGNPGVPDRTYCDQMAVITDWSFDASAFGIPPVVAQASDTTHWLALETAVGAVADAGLEPAHEDRSRIRVILGNSLGGEYARATYLRYRWPYVERAIRQTLEAGRPFGGSAHRGRFLREIRQRYLAPFPEVSEDSLAGTMSNTIAGRICNHFDLGGGGYTVDGACASSLLAVSQACDALVHGEIDFAICGGVDVSLDPYELIGFAKALALATDDIRPYDERADGMLPGEGCGIVVLTRPDIARKRKLRVRAFIRGWGIATDGRGGITAPGREGQARALRQAYHRAGYTLDEVQLIEGHGTGTALGDRVELSALLEVLDSGRAGAREPIRIGSIKSNIGHCKAAAGAAGLIKTMMALERKVLPPTAGCECPHPLFGQFDHIAPLLDAMAWCPESGPRRAGVSAFGFGGCNAHVTLEETHRGTCVATPPWRGNVQASEVIVLSAPNPQALREQVDKAREKAARLSRAGVADLGAQLAARDCGERFRLALVVSSPRHLVEQLERARSNIKRDRIIRRAPMDATDSFALGRVDRSAPPPLVAMFPGQGAQRLGMARHLERRYPFVRTLLDELDEAIADIVPGGVSKWITDDPRTLAPTIRGIREAELEQTHVAQPAIVAASLATLAVLEYHGLRADAFAGHSLGEITALCAAGAFSAPRAIRIAALRGQAMARVDLDDPGAMMLVRCPSSELESWSAFTQPGLEIACYNAHDETVVCGDSLRIEALGRECHGRGVTWRQLPVSHAFHSRRMALAATALRAALTAEQGKPLEARVVSGVSGTWLAPRTDLAALLAQQLTAPVRFAETMECLQEAGANLWLEVGPGGTLSRLVTRCVPGVTALPTDQAGEDGFTQMNRAVARAYVAGLPVATTTLFAHRFHRPVPDGPLNLITNPCEQGTSDSTADSPAGDVAAHPEDTRSTELAFVMAWIAKRIGYPSQKIEPWMRLRDDLNLDSIKAMELLQVLTARHGRVVRSWQQWENLPVGELVDAFLRFADSERDETGAGGLVGPTLPFEPGGAWVRTFQLRPLEIAVRAETHLPGLQPASVFVIGARKDRLAQGLMDELIEAGYAPIWATIGQVASGRVKPVAVGGVVTIAPRAARQWWQMHPGSPAPTTAEEAAQWLGLAKWCAAAAEELGNALRWLVLRPSKGAIHSGAGDAGAGLVKALRVENPAVQPKWIRLPASLGAKRWAQIVNDEFACAGQWVEYAYDHEGRRYAEISSGVPNEAESLPVRAGDVVLATGAAKGITCELALTLAEETGARLAVIGRSGRRTSAVREGMATLSRNGVDARYYPCDVTNAEEVHALVAKVRRQMGPVRGILHGAGITHPAWLGEIDLEPWLDCIRTKVDGFVNLTTVCDLDELVMVHIVTSVIGHTGMPKQLDYAYANAWLAGAVEDLRAQRPGLHALSLAYSAWDETGLGRKLKSVEWMKAFGITTVRTADGCKAYRELLQSAPGNPRRIITGRLAPLLEAGLFAPSPPPRSRFLERWLRWIPGVEAVAEAVIDAERDPYLVDHVFEGTVMLPAVMGIDAMVAAAMSCLDRDDLPVVRDLELARPVVIPPGASVTLRIFALVDFARPERVRVALRTEMDDFSADCFGGWCDFGDATRAPGAVSPYPSFDRETPLDCGPHESLFQGPTFRWLRALRYLDLGYEAVAEAHIPGRIRYFGEHGGAGTVTPHPAARDAFLQLLLLLLEGRGLPTAIAELRFHHRPLAGTAVLVHARKVRSRGEVHEVDIEVRDDGDRLIETLRGVRVEPVRRYRIAEQLDLSQVCANIAAHWPGVALGVGVARADDPGPTENVTARADTARANRLAVSRALADLGKRTGQTELAGVQIRLEHDETGRPRLALDEESAALPPGLEVSITDAARLSIALVAAVDSQPIGIDLESIEPRSDETWRALLGSPGYALALRLASEHFGDLSAAATCAWTMIECAKKSGVCLPYDLDTAVDGPWIVLQADDPPGRRYASIALTPAAGLDSSALLTISLPQ